MSDVFDSAIARLQAKLREQEQGVVKTKTLINDLCEEDGKPPMYRDVELQPSGVGLSIRSDQFYGQPLATCMRQILEMRKAQNQGPATLNELYAALVEGNYLFETKNEENSKRGLRQSLTKNNATFHKLPNGKFGLIEWYSNLKVRKGKTSETGDDATDSEEEQKLLSAPGPKGGD